MSTNKPHASGCLVCGNEKTKARGLCEAHFQRFRAKMRAFATEVERERFEVELERLGWIEEKKRPGRRSSSDIFDKVAESVSESVAEYREKTKSRPAKRKRS